MISDLDLCGRLSFWEYLNNKNIKRCSKDTFVKRNNNKLKEKSKGRKVTNLKVHDDLFCSKLSGIQVDNVVEESVRCKIDGIEHHFVGFQFRCPNHLRINK